MARMNPQLGAALQNPQMRAMLQDPSFIQHITDPNTMQAMAQMQQMFPQGAAGGMPPNFPFPNAFPQSPIGSVGGGGGNLNFSSLFANTAPPAVNNIGSAPNTVNAAARFQSELQQLQDMGFSDSDANLRALVATQGNVNAAVERLLRN
jgi:ubiquilin